MNLREWRGIARKAVATGASAGEINRVFKELSELTDEEVAALDPETEPEPVADAKTASKGKGKSKSK